MTANLKPEKLVALLSEINTGSSPFPQRWQKTFRKQLNWLKGGSAGSLTSVSPMNFLDGFKERFLSPKPTWPTRSKPDSF